MIDWIDGMWTDAMVTRKWGREGIPSVPDMLVILETFLLMLKPVGWLDLTDCMIHGNGFYFHRPKPKVAYYPSVTGDM